MCVTFIHNFGSIENYGMMFLNDDPIIVGLSNFFYFYCMCVCVCFGEGAFMLTLLIYTYIPLQKYKLTRQSATLCLLYESVYMLSFCCR